MASKAQRRAELAALKKLDFEDKRAGQVEKILTKKIPGSEIAPVPAKVPVLKKGESRFAHNVEYNTQREDRDGSWSWGASREWHPKPGNDYIYSFLNGCCGKTWQEIDSEVVGKKGGGGKTDKRHKFYPITSICREAQNRLIDLKLDDQEHIFRFRLTGKHRLYGFVAGIIFSIVWFDELHLVYPTRV